jgi:histidine ammonia-lyase
MADNAATIIALEWLAAAQGVDFHRPLTAAVPLAQAVTRLRREVPHLDSDRYFAADIATAKRMLLDGALADIATAPLLESAAA